MSSRTIVINVILAGIVIITKKVIIKIIQDVMRIREPIVK